QTRKRKTTSPSSTTHASAEAAQRRTAEIQAGRERVAIQIKNLTQFLYLLGGITNGIELAEQANRSRRSSPVSVPPEQIARNKAQVNESVRNVRVGLEDLESSFRSSSILQTYYRYVSGVGAIGRDAESQAAANRFDESGRSLIKAANQLTDALVALH
ncbi:MAG TPA: hypothetical protein VFV34_21800, partial [Blastocatellia bacterium]|nr:hypothetical protein [Blastocatellia bacterium]